MLEVVREDEFSPLKNAPGADKDTPKTAMNDLMSLNYRQLCAAGVEIETQSGVGSEVVECEVSPLVSYFGEVSLPKLDIMYQTLCFIGTSNLQRKEIQTSSFTRMKHISNLFFCMMILIS